MSWQSILIPSSPVRITPTLAQDQMDLGAAVLPPIPKDTTDRNRTSPFAFTGNKFEFRSLGSAVNIACTNVMLNTAVAEELRRSLTSWRALRTSEAAVYALN